MTEATYPIRLHLRDRGVLVVGGGTVATRKLERLVTVGANVRVVTREASDRIEMWAAERLLMLERRPVRASDVNDAFVVIVATDDGEVNAQLAAAAQQRGALVLRADCAESSDFSVPAVADSTWVESTISTRGTAPAASRRLKRELVRWIAGGPDRFVREVANAREKLRGLPGAANRLRALAEGDLFEACTRADDAHIFALVSGIGSEP
jgi:siroheme synthase-like protein